MEIWKDIKGYEGSYSISTHGNVKSLRRKRTGNGKKGIIRERILKATPNGDGYPTVKLYKHGNSEMFKVHKLVADAFIPIDKNKDQINHIDGDKANNHISNLERCTQQENIIHAFENGLNNSKLNIDMDKFKRMADEGMDAREMASELKCSISTIRRRAKQNNIKIKRRDKNE